MSAGTYLVRLSNLFLTSSSAAKKFSVAPSRSGMTQHQYLVVGDHTNINYIYIFYGHDSY